MLHHPACLGKLVQFLQPHRQADDLRVLAAVAAAVLQPAADGSHPLLAAAASARADAARQAQYRVQRLCSLIVGALVAHAERTPPALSSSKAAAGAAGDPSALLVDGLVAAMAPESWQARGAQADNQAATAAAQGMTSALVRRGLFRQLQKLLQQAAGIDLAGSSSSRGGSLLDLLVTQSTVRTLALRAPSGPATAAAPPQQVHQLLYTPGLWRLCPSLQLVSRHVCRRALAELAGAPMAAPPGCAGGSAGGAAALLVNLLAAGPGVLAAAGDGVAAGQAAAVLCALLPSLPTDLLGGISSGGSHAASAAAASGRGGSGDSPTAAGPAFLPSPSGRNAHLQWQGQGPPPGAAGAAHPPPPGLRTHPRPSPLLHLCWPAFRTRTCPPPSLPAS